MTATTSIPQLPAATSVDGTEELPAVQNGVDKRFTVNQIANFVIPTWAPVYPELFGARGNGVADDSAAVARALATPNIVLQTKPGSTYRIGTRRTVVLPDNADFDLRLYIDVTSGIGLTLGGQVAGTDLTLASSVAKGDFLIPLNSTSSLSTGQWGKLYSNRWFDAARTQTRIGEIVRIAGLTGNTIVTETPLDDSYRSDRIAQFSISAGGTSYVVGDYVMVPGGTPALTWTVTNVNTTTGVLTLNASATTLTATQIVRVTSTSTNPSGISSTTAYFAGSISGSTVVLYSTVENALNATSPVVPSTSGSGTITLSVPQAMLVTDVSSGAITGMEWAVAPTAGPTYSVLPTGTVTLVGGSGSSAQVALTAEVPLFTPLTMANNTRGVLNLTGNLATSQLSGVDFYLCHNAAITQTSTGFTGQAAGFADCVFSTMTTLCGENSYPGLLGYACYANDAARDCALYMPTGRNIRHAFQTGSEAARPGVTTRISFRAGTLSASAPAGDDPADYNFTVTNVNTGTGALTTSPAPSGQLTTDQRAFITSTISLPTGYYANFLYWVNVSGATVTLHTNKVDATAGTNPVIPSTVGSGTIMVVVAPPGDIIKTHAAAREIYVEFDSIDANTGSAVTIEASSAVIRGKSITRAQGLGAIAIGNYTSEIGNYSIDVQDISGGTDRCVYFFGASSPIESVAIKGRFRDSGGAGLYLSMTAYSPIMKLDLDAAVLNCCMTIGNIQAYMAYCNVIRGRLLVEAHAVGDIGVEFNNSTDFDLTSTLIFFPPGATNKAIYVAGTSDRGLITGVMVRAPNSASLTGVFLDNTVTNVRIGTDTNLTDCTTAVTLGAGAGNSYGSAPDPIFSGTLTVTNSGTYPQFVGQRNDNPGVAGQPVADFKGLGRNSAGTLVAVGELLTYFDTVTAGAEIGRWRFASMITAVSTSILDIDTHGMSLVKGTVKFGDATTNVTGSVTATLGANCPAVTPTVPYTWFKTTAADGSTVYLPAWK